MTPKNWFSRSRPLQLMEPVFKHFHQKMHTSPPSCVSFYISLLFVTLENLEKVLVWSFIPNTAAKTIALL